MKSIVCTLFEGDYHYGVGALSNSLFASGFRSTIFAGYRGELPDWAQSSVSWPSDNWKNARVLPIKDGTEMVFLPLETTYHLTNYKPDFMMRVLTETASNAGAIFYFDPDITTLAPWNFFEEWVEAGVALCEDINSPLFANHPRRMAWRSYFRRYGFNFSFKEIAYVNGGFQGLTKRDFDFLTLWKSIQEAMAPAVGGLDRSALQGKSLDRARNSPVFCFNKTDQDALNVTVEATSAPVSIIGKEGMGFVPGGYVMAHAAGKLKPWSNSFVRTAMAGYPPTLADRCFWRNVEYPLRIFSENALRRKQYLLAVAGAIGRFYSRK